MPAINGPRDYRYRSVPVEESADEPKTVTLSAVGLMAKTRCMLPGSRLLSRGFAHTKQRIGPICVCGDARRADAFYAGRADKRIIGLRPRRAEFLGNGKSPMDRRRRRISSPDSVWLDTHTRSDSDTPCTYW